MKVNSLLILVFISSLSAFGQIDSSYYNSTSDSVRTVNYDAMQDGFYKLSFKAYNLFPTPKDSKHSEIKLIDAQTYVMSNGLTVILVENRKLPLVSYKMYFDINKLPLGKKKGSGLVFMDIWGKKGQAFSRKDILEYQERLRTKMDVGENYIFVQGLARHKYNNMSMLSDLTLNLQITDEDFAESKQRVSDSLYFASRKNSFITENIGKNLLFGNNNPIGERIDLYKIDSLKVDDIRDHYSNYYNSSNAYLLVYGDIGLSELKQMTSMYFKKFKKSIVKRGYYSQPYNLQSIEIDFVENYNQDSLSVWMANIEDQTSYEANWVFNRVAKNLLFDVNKGMFTRRLLGNKLVSNLKYHLDITDKYFSISYETSPQNVSNSILTSLDILKTSVSERIDSLLMNEIKISLNKNYISGLRDPHTISDYYIMHYLTGADDFLMPNFMATIDSLKRNTISTVLDDIIKPDRLRIVISGPPQQALPELEKLNYPIRYFDQLGRETFPPSLDRPAPDSISAEWVLTRYEKSIGGKLKLDDVEKMLQWWVMKIDNQKLYVKSKFMLPHRRLSTYSNKEVILMKTVFNGEFGYIESGGVVNEYEGMQYLKLSTERSIFPERYYLEDGYIISLKSQIPLKGEMCYKLYCESTFGEITQLYFRVSDGFLVRREELDPKTEKVVNYFEYSDFKRFEDIVFPYNIETEMSGKKVNLILTQIRLNDKNVKKRNFN